MSANLMFLPIFSPVCSGFIVREKLEHFLSPSSCCCTSPATLIICYRAVLSAPVTIFSLPLSQGEKSALKKHCTSERKRRREGFKKGAESKNADEDTDIKWGEFLRVNQGVRTPKLRLISQTAIFNDHVLPALL